VKLLWKFYKGRAISVLLSCLDAVRVAAQ